MQAMICSAPPQAGQVSMSMPDTRFSLWAASHLASVLPTGGCFDMAQQTYTKLGVSGGYGSLD